MHAHQEVCLGGILHAAGVGVDVLLGTENGIGHGEHRVFNAEDGLVAVLFQRGQDEAVLAREQIEDGNVLQAARDEIRKRVGDNDRNDDLVIAADFKNHEDGSYGSTKESGEENAHADQDIGSRRSGEVRKIEALDITHSAAEHGSDEESRSKHAAGSAANEGDRGGDD